MDEEIQKHINPDDDYEDIDIAYEHAQGQDSIKDSRNIRDKFIEYQKIQHKIFNNRSSNIIKFAIIQGIITIIWGIFLANGNNSIHIILLFISTVSIILQFIFIGCVWKWILYSNPYNKSVNRRRVYGI